MSKPDQQSASPCVSLFCLIHRSCNGAIPTTPLANPMLDIKLIDLLPGHRSDDVVISIRHASLTSLPAKKRKRPSLKELEKTLPPGCMVRENPKGRQLFIRPISLYNWHKAWKHPDGMFGPELQEDDTVDPRPTCALYQPPSTPSCRVAWSKISDQYAGSLDAQLSRTARRSQKIVTTPDPDSNRARMRIRELAAKFRNEIPL
ncbi:hypothetical protein B0T20DRAFT_395854 [Sordaria brevicollis]|uniref:Uncharacterized protein n=1 Tax=Sordaria brevicollis TaxID=83679 RepID=A0AAE0P2V5_SORBR|nr:hypothetical protein B0T20DRAFT_395854 [Sordaria brevicollis]